MPIAPLRRPALAGRIACAALALAAPRPARAAAADCALAFTPIPAIQGAGAAAAITGPVTTQGVVTGDFQGPWPALRGFYLQDPAGDGDPATSDALFVFAGDVVAVSLGQWVRVSGTAGEYQGQTQIAATAVVDCGRSALPAPVDVVLPLASADALEAVEGMLVRLPQTLTVTDVWGLGRFGELTLATGRLARPTEVAAPGAPALAIAAANARARIRVDDGGNEQNPDPIPFWHGDGPFTAADPIRAGDLVSGLAGVLTWGWGGASASPNAFRLRPLGALGGSPPSFGPTLPRPALPPAIGGRVRVAGANLFNWFDTVGTGCAAGVGGPPVDCRGADDATELARQGAKLVALLLGLGADAIGVTELENDGYGAPSAIAALVERLEAASAPGAWAFVDADAGTGRSNALGSDAIKVGIVYRPATLAPLGPPAVLDTGAFGPFATTRGTIQRNRPVLAQSFAERATGERFTLAVAHLKSRGSSCAGNVSPVGPDPDRGDGQGHCNATRTAAAQQLAAWLAADPTGAGDPDVLLVGDLNAYAQEDPLAALRAGGLVDVLVPPAGTLDYSYGFDGEFGRLDHALASPSLAARVTGAATWHVNADEPPVLGYEVAYKSARQLAALYAPDAFRSSDHDPLLVGLALPEPAPAAGAAAAGAALAAARRRRRASLAGRARGGPRMQASVGKASR